MRCIARFLASCLLIMAGCAAEAKDYPFTLAPLKTKSGYQLIAHNKGLAPVSAVISIDESTNLGSEQQWPVMRVIPPDSDLLIGEVYPRDPTAGFSFRTSVVHMIGMLGARHDPAAVYRLPYSDGRAFTISQAAGSSTTTHNTPESKFAVDFTMPEGTPVLAARDGVVIDVEDGYTEGNKTARMLTQANDVRILHVDGTIASYAHLKANGVAVKIGQNVKAGKRIGYAGSTGYSSGPHLHFVVTTLVESNGELSAVSVPIIFYAENPNVAFEPRAGMRVTANYGATVEPATRSRQPEKNTGR